ncbi:hypothetical protein ACG7TL_005529 [Trametes sanguinea]
MSAIASLIDLNSTFGALFIGFGASSVAFGVLSMQSYSYFRRYPGDVRWYKCLVAAIWVLELVDQALIGHAVYFYVVTNWGEVVALLEGPVWTLIVQVILGATVGAIVKICFGLRVWRFSRHNVPVTMLIMLGTVAQLAAAFVFTVKAFHIPSLATVGSLKLVGSIALGLGMATDVITAAALCYFLRGLKTGYHRDDSIVNTLTLYAINTGVITSAISLSTLILYDLMPTNFIFMAFYFVLSKVYANSFFAALNTRRSVRGRGTEGDHTTVPTFLMVGQTTKQEVHTDPIYSIQHSSMNRSNAEFSPRMEVPREPPIAAMPPLHYAQACHAVHKNVTRTPSALQSQSLSAESPVVIPDTLATAYTARLAAAQSERLEWERSAALLVQRQADLAMIRARLADPRHASSSKYDSLDTARLLALRDSRLQDLLRGSWRDDEGRRALQLVTSLAGLVDTANSSASPPGARVDEIGMRSSSTCKESQVPTALDAALSLPIAAARHPSHLHGLRAPLFPKAKPSPASNEDGAQAPHLSYAVEERFAAIEDVHRSLQEALAATQAIHARLDQRLRKAKGRQPTSAPARTSKARPLKLDGSLWAQRAGDGVSFKSPEDAASLLSQYDLQMPLSESSIEARIAQIRTTMLPPFTADPSPEPEAEPEPLPNLPASRLPQASSRTRTTKPASAQPGHRPSRPAIAGQHSSRVRIAEDSVQATRARDAAGQSKDEKARAGSRTLSRRASAARARRSTMFGRGEDAEILRIVASVQDRSGSEDEDENDMVRDQGSHLPNGRLRTPMRTQRHLGTRGMLLSTAKKTAPRQSYDIDVHERARPPRLPSLRLSDAPELDEDEPRPQNVPVGGEEEAVYEGTSMTLADILMHAGHQGNASIQLLEEEMEDETSDWE